MQDKGEMLSELTVVTRFGFVTFVSLNLSQLQWTRSVPTQYHIAAISQTTFDSAFPCMKTFEF